MTETTAAGSGRTHLQLNALSKSYGDNLAVRSITADVLAHQISVIVGPSGCGKSTLLKMVSGLEVPTSGEVQMSGEVVSGVPDGLAMVFQDYSRSLYPWMRVAANVAFPIRRLPKAERAERVRSAIAEVGLSGKEDLYPWQMSGGMQQRVAIARALACHPTLLLMDEPYASVDAHTRADLEDLLMRIQHELGITVLVVTHDIDESIYLADRVFVLSAPPSTVTEVIEIDLPRPRDHVTTKSDPRFAELRTHIVRLMRSPDAQTSAVQA